MPNAETRQKFGTKTRFVQALPCPNKPVRQVFGDLLAYLWIPATLITGGWYQDRVGHMSWTLRRQTRRDADLPRLHPSEAHETAQSMYLTGCLTQVVWGPIL